MINVSFVSDCKITTIQTTEHFCSVQLFCLFGPKLYYHEKTVCFEDKNFPCDDAKGFDSNEIVDVVIRPEDLDVVPREQGMLKGVVTSVTFLGVHYEIIVDINGFKWMIQTTDFVDVDAHIGLYIEPDAIHVMKKSEYSGMFGDYSSYSMELDEIGELEEENLEELGELSEPDVPESGAAT